MRGFVISFVLPLVGCSSTSNSLTPIAVNPHLIPPPVPTPQVADLVAIGEPKEVRAMSQLELEILRAYMEHNWPRSVQEDGRRYYLSLQAGLDPDKSALAWFTDRGYSMEPGSRFRESRGVKLSVSSVIASGDIARFEGGWHGGPFAGQAGIYRFRQTESRWIFDGIEVELIE